MQALGTTKWGRNVTWLERPEAVEAAAPETGGGAGAGAGAGMGSPPRDGTSSSMELPALEAAPSDEEFLAKWCTPAEPEGVAARRVLLRALRPWERTP